MMTLELGRTRTWRLPRFSALTMLLRQSDCDTDSRESVRQVLHWSGQGRKISHEDRHTHDGL